MRMKQNNQLKIMFQQKQSFTSKRGKGSQQTCQKLLHGPCHGMKKNNKLQKRQFFLLVITLILLCMLQDNLCYLHPCLVQQVWNIQTSNWIEWDKQTKSKLSKSFQQNKNLILLMGLPCKDDSPTKEKKNYLNLTITHSN